MNENYSFSMVFGMGTDPETGCELKAQQFGDEIQITVSSKDEESFIRFLTLMRERLRSIKDRVNPPVLCPNCNAFVDWTGFKLLCPSCKWTRLIQPDYCKVTDVPA
jgi:hypothetical protein